MGLTLHLKKNGIRYIRNVGDLLYAEADSNSCILYFKNGEMSYTEMALQFFSYWKIPYGSGGQFLVVPR